MALTLTAFQYKTKDFGSKETLDFQPLKCLDGRTPLDKDDGLVHCRNPQGSSQLKGLLSTSIPPHWSSNAKEILHYLSPLSATTVMATAQHQKNEGDFQRRMLAMLYTKDNDILQTYMILQWWISLVFLSNRTQAAGSKYLLDLYQSMCHIYKVIFSMALGRKANAALDFCLQGLKSFTLDSCYPPPLTQDLSCTEECLFICCCCCTATKRKRVGEAARLGVLMRKIVRKLVRIQKLFPKNIF